MRIWLVLLQRRPFRFFSYQVRRAEEEKMVEEGIQAIHPKRAVLILLSASLAVFYMHFREIDIPKRVERQELHSQIVDGTGPSPYRYRVLLPYLAEASARAFRPLFGYDRALLLSYGVLEAGLIVLLVIVLYEFFCEFFPPSVALLGALFVDISMIVALRDHFFQPWSLANALSFALGASLIYRKKFFLFALVVLVSSFNRETSVLLSLMYFFAFAGKGNIKRPLATSMLLVAIWLGPFFLVRGLQGGAPHIHHLSEILRKNLAGKNVAYAIVNLFLFFGAFWFFALKGLRGAPSFIKKISMFIPFYLPLVIFFGVWKEVRLLMLLYPVVVPMGLSFLFPAGANGDDSS